MQRFTCCFFHQKKKKNKPGIPVQPIAVSAQPKQSITPAVVDAPTPSQLQPQPEQSTVAMSEECEVKSPIPTPNQRLSDSSDGPIFIIDITPKFRRKETISAFSNNDDRKLIVLKPNERLPIPQPASTVSFKTPIVLRRKETFSVVNSNNEAKLIVLQPGEYLPESPMGSAGIKHLCLTPPSKDSSIDNPLTPRRNSTSLTDKLDVDERQIENSTRDQQNDSPSISHNKIPSQFHLSVVALTDPASIPDGPLTPTIKAIPSDTDQPNSDQKRLTF